LRFVVALLSQASCYFLMIHRRGTSRNILLHFCLVLSSSCATCFKKFKTTPFLLNSRGSSCI